MPGKIPQSFIDDLLARVDIVDVVDRLVPLRKTGREHQACCPFHDEKTPSFTVSPQKQFYHCFGCGAHGTAISFLMEYQGLSFPETLAELASRVGLEMPAPEETGGQYQQSSENLTRLYEVNEFASQFFQTQLRQHPDKQTAVDYLKQRGLSGTVAARFSVGFAPESWDALRLGLASQVSDQELDRLGLTIPRENGPGQYDRFRNRIIFPIIDNRGRTCGFGGRAFGDDKPKYLNSPETPLFHKSQELYGLYQVLQTNKTPPRLVVVEGYMDVIALHQHGVTGAVATMGTATTPEHLRRLFRISPEIVFCFDGDQAGRKAAWKALETALPLMSDGRRVRILFLPDGEDPDSLVREIGEPEFTELLQRARPLLDTLFSQLLEDIDLSSLDGRSLLLGRAKPLLDRLPTGSLKQIGFDRLAELSRMRQPETSQPSSQPNPRNRRQITHNDNPQALVARGIALLLHHPEFADNAPPPTPLKQLDDPLITAFISLMELTQARGERPMAAVLHQWQAEMSNPFDDGTLQSEALLKSDDAAAQEFSDLLARLGQLAEQTTLQIPPQGLSLADLTSEQKEQLRRTGKILK